jgi:hypothetical protein
MTNFTPVTGLIGGALIGLAATLFVLVNGRIAGISGILGGVLDAPSDELGWRSAFLAGLIIGPLLTAAVGGAVPDITLQASLPMPAVPAATASAASRGDHRDRYGPPSPFLRRRRARCSSFGT